MRTRSQDMLDNILLKALQKEPERRYASVEEHNRIEIALQPPAQAISALHASGGSAIAGQSGSTRRPVRSRCSVHGGAWPLGVGGAHGLDDVERIAALRRIG